MENTELMARAAIGGPDKPVQIDNKTREEWNKYVDFLEKKGLKGHPSLDHDDLSNRMLDEFKKENPNTILDRNMIIPIQQDFSKYRDYALDEVKNKRAAFGEGVNEENFLRALSTVDGIAGQRTTSFKFPSGYMADRNKNETRSGFMKTGKAASDQLASFE